MARKLKRIILAGCTAVVLGAVSACTPIFQDHGYIPPQDELEQIVVGIDTRASVEDTVGPPTSEALVSDNGYFYVKSRMRAFAFQAPKEVDRQVLAITFDADGVVANIERFTLEDGVVVPISRRVTETGITNTQFLRHLLSGIGQFTPATFGQ